MRNLSTAACLYSSFSFAKEFLLIEDVANSLKYGNPFCKKYSAI
jgi:hypothetical protein